MSESLRIVRVVYAKPVLAEEAGRVSRLLIDKELQRAAAFRIDADRLLFVTCRALLRTRLSEVADVAPTDWKFTTNRYGRPQVAEPQQFRHIKFNVSHTQGLVMCAVSDGANVGVDAEMIQEPHLDVVDRFFSPSEVTAIRRSEGPLLAQAFFRYWTLKEAYIKARGTGLSLALDSFAIEIGTDGSISLRIEDHLAADPREWHLRSAQPLPTHLAAICVEVKDAMGVSILESWAETWPVT